MANQSISASQLLALARRGQRLTHIAAVLPLTALFLILVPLLVLSPVFALVPQLGTLIDEVYEGPPLWSAALFSLALAAQFLPAILAVWAWLALWERRPFWTLGFEQAGAVRRYLAGATLGIALYGCALGISGAFGFLAPEQGSPAQQGAAALGGVLLVYLGWTIQGPAEEIVFRGWLLQSIGARYRPWLGIVISSALFALGHGLNAGIGPLPIVNLLLFGVLTSLYALREGGLWGVCGMHAAWNWAQGNLFGIEVSGNPTPGGMLFNLREVGPDLVTGGAFGTEGGLACTAVLGVGILMLAYRSWNGRTISQPTR
jgi:uncharacterized protein